MKIEKSTTTAGLYNAFEERNGKLFVGSGYTQKEAMEDCLKKINWYEEDFEDDMKADGDEAEAKELIDEENV